MCFRKLDKAIERTVNARRKLDFGLILAMCLGASGFEIGSGASLEDGEGCRPAGRAKVPCGCRVDMVEVGNELEFLGVRHLRSKLLTPPDSHNQSQLHFVPLNTLSRLRQS